MTEEEKNIFKDIYKNLIESGGYKIHYFAPSDSLLNFVDNLLADKDDQIKEITEARDNIRSCFTSQKITNDLLRTENEKLKKEAKDWQIKYLCNKFGTNNCLTKEGIDELESKTIEMMSIIQKFK